MEFSGLVVWLTFDPPSSYSQTQTWLVLNSWHIVLLLLSLLRDWVILLHFPRFLMLAFTLLSFSSHSSRADPELRPSLDGRRGVLGSTPNSPHVQGARGCWLTTPSSHEQGLDGKDGQVGERVWVLVTAVLMSAPCSCSANKKKKKKFTFTPPFPFLKWFSGNSSEWNWINWSSHERQMQ